MGVVISKSLAITQRDSVPTIRSNGNIQKAAIKSFIGHVVAANGDSIGSTYLFGQIPSNARISTMKLSCTAIAVSGAIELGLYAPTTPQGPGAVVSVAFFSGAQVVTAALSGLNLANSGVDTLALCEQEVWQLLGLAVDPAVNYDVVATVTTAMGGAGDIVIEGSYVE